MDAAKNSTLKSSILATGLSYLVKANLSCRHAEGSPNHLLSFSSPLQMLEDLFLMCLNNLKGIKMFCLAGRATYIFVKLNSLLQNVIHSISGFELGPFSRPWLDTSHPGALSAVMKDDICDKRTDHKLSNHSRTCLLAASTVTLCTLSPSVSAQLPLSAALGCRVGRTRSEFTLTGAKVSHIVAKGTRSQH